jgi:hypothetical protein
VLPAEGGWSRSSPPSDANGEGSDVQSVVVRRSAPGDTAGHSSVGDGVSSADVVVVVYQQQESNGVLPSLSDVRAAVRATHLGNTRGGVGKTPRGELHASATASNRFAACGQASSEGVEPPTTSMASCKRAPRMVTATHDRCGVAGLEGGAEARQPRRRQVVEWSSVPANRMTNHSTRLATDARRNRPQPAARPPRSAFSARMRR